MPHVSAPPSILYPVRVSRIFHSQEGGAPADRERPLRAASPPRHHPLVLVSREGSWTVVGSNHPYGHDACGEKRFQIHIQIDGRANHGIGIEFHWADPCIFFDAPRAWVFREEWRWAQTKNHPTEHDPQLTGDIYPSARGQNLWRRTTSPASHTINSRTRHQISAPTGVSSAFSVAKRPSRPV